jgi:hypothetical protein
LPSVHLEKVQSRGNPLTKENFSEPIQETPVGIVKEWAAEDLGKTAFPSDGFNASSRQMTSKNRIALELECANAYFFAWTQFRWFMAAATERPMLQG